MTTVPFVLVIDDELHIRRLVASALRRAGFEPLEAESAAAAMELIERHDVKAAFIDLGLPDKDGLELVADIARRGGIIMIVISARDAIGERISALDLGADDFIGKPFDTGEMLARLRAALRRSSQPANPNAMIVVGDIEIDPDAHIVRKSGNEIHLTPKEFDMLAMLGRHAGCVVTHAQILRAVWGPAHERDIEYLRVTARNLRRKLEADPSQPKLIRNEPGIGYRWTL